jgi:phospholipid-binding lipoprotein MlaA
MHRLTYVYAVLMVFISITSVHCESFSPKTGPAGEKESGFIEEALSDDEMAEFGEYNDDVLYEPDPLEGMNRGIFTVNRIIDGMFLKPAATLYENCVHDTGKIGVRNVVDNAFSPVTMFNHALQGEGERAFRTFFRFIINTTIGMLGLIDAADGMGLKKEPTTLNHTFARWGMGTGPYIVLPVLGPSSGRDTLSRLGEYYMNPFGYMASNRHRKGNHHLQQRHWLRVLYGLDAVDLRRQFLVPLADLERLSPDFYVGMRSAFFQKQQKIEREARQRAQERQHEIETFQQEMEKSFNEKR